jgi:hypothetical protein
MSTFSPQIAADGGILTVICFEVTALAFWLPSMKWVYEMYRRLFLGIVTLAEVLKL